MNGGGQWTKDNKISTNLRKEGECISVLDQMELEFGLLETLFFVWLEHSRGNSWCCHAHCTRTTHPGGVERFTFSVLALRVSADSQTVSYCIT